MANIKQKKILILATDGFEQSELAKPLEQLRKAGATVHITSPSNTRKAGEIMGWDGTGAHTGGKADWGTSVPVDVSLDSVKASDYDALVIPGGQINPDKLRTEAKAVQLVKDFYQAGKTVAAVCHGPWLLAEAGVINGKQLTSFKSIKTDMTNAGAKWVDQEVVSDQGLVTSRNPGDLDAFVSKIIEEVSEGTHSGR